jgi:hypothetical protein
MARPIPKVVLPMIFHEVKIQAALGEGHVNLVQVTFGDATLEFSYMYTICTYQ